MKLPFTDCCELLAVDSETLSRWLRQAVQDFSLHPGELERKSLSLEQVRYLAAVFDHMRSPLSRSEHPDLDGDLLEEEADDLFFSQTEEISQMKKLLRWEMKITAIQQWLAQLSLEFHQECFQEQNASCLPSTMNKEQGPDQSNGEQQKTPKPSQSKTDKRKERRPHPAESRRRPSLPCIEWSNDEIYTITCPGEEVCQIPSDSPEWFAWLASVVSFRFVGKQGRMSVYRDYDQGYTRSWYGYRRIKKQNHKRRLGVTERITIGILEQAAAHLQALDDVL